MAWCNLDVCNLGALHGGALVIHRFWKTLRRPMPHALAWLMTFLFVNVTWIFFRAKTLNDAMRVLQGMLDFSSVYTYTPAAIQTLDLAWGGWLSDVLLRFMPAGLIGQAPTYLAIILAFALIARKNSMEMTLEFTATRKMTYGILLFGLAMYFMLAATSSVFLYFNF